MSGDRAATITDVDKKTADEVLKRMADLRFDWTEQQKQQYKILVDSAEHMG